MLRAVIIFAVLALVSAAVGFSGIASAFGSIAYILAVVFAVLFVASLVMHAARGTASAF